MQRNPKALKAEQKADAVISAQAGRWIPAYAGMTAFVCELNTLNLTAMSIRNPIALRAEQKVVPVIPAQAGSIHDRAFCQI